VSEPIVIRGERVTLRPFLDDEAEALVTHGVVVSGDPRKLVAVSGTWGDDGVLRLAVESEGRLVGDIQARHPKRGLPPGVYELGINLFDTGDRRRGLGREATALLTDHLFEDAGTGRVQLSTDVDNTAMRRVAVLLGFVEEGVMRGFMPGDDGGRRDYVLYAVTRDDWRK
jgi:RimJ/RimL family protein N-acetyltransferase